MASLGGFAIPIALSRAALAGQRLFRTELRRASMH